ncbi:shikimate kinase [Flavobacteriales bacterium 34_180_T64]|nr:shikimate kinase [Flavobacteriales bacterium 34_180_T64]
MIIVLMGYMASGKSTIGKELADKLNFNFIDLDDYIENREECTIKEIFKSSGEIYFRKKETVYLEEVLNTTDKIVLSLGGGTPCYGRNMQLISNASKVKSFYLKVSINNVLIRLENETTKRPLIAHIQSKDELLEFIGKHMFERLQFYNEAQFNIDTDNTSLDAIVEEIVFKLF